MNGKNNHFYSILVPMIIILLWGIIAVIYGILRTKQETIAISGYIPLIGQVGFDLLAAISCFALWKRAGEYQRVFLLYGLSFVMAAISDASYNFIINIKQIIHYSIFIDSIWDIPFILFLLFQTCAWVKLFYINFDHKDRKIITNIPYGLTGLIIFLSYTFGMHWKIKILSTLGIYQIIDTVLEIISFIFASFCHIRSRVIAIRYLSAGYMIIIASDFLIRYYVIIGRQMPNNLFEATWILGLILMVIGFYYIKENLLHPNIPMLMPVNSLASQAAIWLYTICLFSLFFLELVINIVILFERKIVIPEMRLIPIILISFAALSAILSRIISARFFKTMHYFQNLIHAFNNKQKYYPDSKTFYIREFQELKKFMADVFSMQLEKSQRDKEMGRLSMQIAHDIRTPLLALESLTDECFEEQSKHAEVLRRISRRVNDIAKNFLDVTRKYRASEIIYGQTVFQIQAIFPLVEEVVLEKDIQCKHKNIKLCFNVDNAVKALSVRICSSEFKRALSNVIDNAIQAINHDFGEISIFQLMDNEYLRIEVQDNGCGIPNEKLHIIFQDGVTIGKTDGYGLGLTYVEQVIKSMNGKINVSSQVEVGTIFIISLPIAVD